MKNSFFSKFTPKEPKFFPLLKQLSDVLSASSVLLVESMEHDLPTERADYYKQIKDMEREGDRLTHLIFDELSTTFITPFDREDIHDLASCMDDVIDGINSSAKRIVIYNPRPISESGKELSRLIHEEAINIGKAMDELETFRKNPKPLRDQQTFDLVQKIRSNVRRYPNGWGEAAPLTGLLYCADCGGKMYVHRTNNGKRISQYTCSNYTKVPCGTLCPTQHRINESAVLTLVSDTLRAIAEYSRNDRTEFIHTVQETQVAQQSADISKKRRRLAAAQKRAGELEKLICKIYEDNALGKLPDARYRALDAQYAKEQGALEIEIAELEKAVTGYEQSQKSAEKFIALIDKYENFDTMTNTMLNEFVEKILVHERARKGSQDTTQEIEIYFNFLGRYIPPSLQPVPLTPEEQEELRKKEERKDRLHQNYLERKSSGAQKRYEDKIKAQKKAEMDAKKALIRAEDMKKGVFSTVGQLPKEEPRKGSMAASAAV